MTRAYRYGLLGLLALLGFGCSERLAPISPIPELTLLELSPTTARQFEDTVRIRLRYRDGDGDLGTAEADSSNLWVRDTRLGLDIAYRIPQQGPSGVTLALTGTLVVPVARIPLQDSTRSSETVVFELYCRDRAGNRSNTLVCPPITLLR